MVIQKTDWPSILQRSRVGSYRIYEIAERDGEALMDTIQPKVLLRHKESKRMAIKYLKRTYTKVSFLCEKCGELDTVSISHKNKKPTKNDFCCGARYKISLDKNYKPVIKRIKDAE